MTFAGFVPTDELEQQGTLMSTKKLYDIVYIDPPWQFNARNNTGTSFGGGAMAHYPTMPMKEISNLDFTKIMKPNGLMYCWVTLAKLDQCITAMAKKNLVYVTTGFVWIKTNKKGTLAPTSNKLSVFDKNEYRNVFYGVGNYTASNAEICLIFRKGRMVKHKTKVSQVIISPLDVHSKKPQEARDLLNIMYPSPEFDKIEIFARTEATGFDIVGNQSNNIDIRDFLASYTEENFND